MKRESMRKTHIPNDVEKGKDKITDLQINYRLLVN